MWFVRSRDAGTPSSLHKKQEPISATSSPKGVRVFLLLAGPVQAGRVLTPVAQFVEGGAIELVQALKGRLGRNLDVIPRRAVERLAPAVSDACPGCLDGILGGLVIDGEGLVGVRLTCPQVVQVFAFNLIDVEDGVEPENEEAVLLLVALVRSARSWSRGSRSRSGMPHCPAARDRVAA